MRAPIRLYRWRLGALFGTRLLMLEHVGRTSGEPRYVVLEIVDRPDSGGYVVASGFGTNAQWYRNIIVNPRVRVYLGSNRPIRAVARPLPLDEAADSLQKYAQKYPQAWVKLRPVFERTLGTKITENGTALPLVLITEVDRN